MQPQPQPQRRRRLFCRIFILLLFVGVDLLFPIQPAGAEILVEENFSHPNGNLLGLVPVPGPGSVWTALADEGSVAIQVIGGKTVLSQGSGSGGREDAIITFPRQPSTATTYARFDFSLPRSENIDIANLDAMGSNFVHFKSNLLTTHFRARTGVLAPAGDGDFRLAINANGSRLDEGVVWANGLTFDAIYRVVISWNAATGESKLWLNPANELSTSISNTGHSTGQRLESFALRQSSDYFGMQFVDNLVVATTFTEALNDINGVSIDGDFDGDGDVDGFDFLKWQRGESPNPTTSTDLNDWQTNFGTGSLLAAGQAVAEPASGLLALAATATIALLRSRATTA